MMAPPPMPADIFLSYAHQDIERARSLAEALASQGWSVFWDRHIPPGRTFEDYIEQRLRECRAIVVMWSPDAVASTWVKIEAAQGRDRGVLIPVLIAPAAIPFGYGHLQAADLTAWRPDSKSLEFNELVSAIDGLVPRNPPASLPLPAQTRAADTSAADDAVGVPVPLSSTTLPAASNEPHTEEPPGEGRRSVKRQSPGWAPELLSPALRRFVRWRPAVAVAAALLVTVASYSLYRLRVPAAPNSTPVSSAGTSDKGTPPATVPATPVPTPVAPATTPASRDSSSTTAVTPPPTSIVGRSTTPVSGEPSGNRGTVPKTTTSLNLPVEPLLGFIEIPAGPFLMGSDKSRDTLADDDERWTKTGGQGKLDLQTFYLGRHEVTVAQFKAYVEATGVKPGDARSLQGPGDHPVRYVSWHEAIAY